MYNKLFPYVRNKVTSHQSGFLNKQSTTTGKRLIVYISTSQRRLIKCPIPSCSTIFDLSASVVAFCAFFIPTYPVEPNVMVNGIKSRLANIRSGVPQGSIQGPILILFLINDLPDQCFATVPNIFADDFKFS